MISGDLLKNLKISNGESAKPSRPVSIDLSVGSIFKPPSADGNTPTGETVVNVAVGGTVVVETEETLTMPLDKAGLMFPKSSALAEKGILITNFGLVDPGYVGNLKFVVINLGKHGFSLRRHDALVHLVVFDLGEDAPGYEADKQRLSGKDSALLLSDDFVSVTERAKTAAEREVRKSIVTFGTILSLFLIVPTILVSLFLAFAPPVLEKWDWAYEKNGAAIFTLTEELDSVTGNVETLTNEINALKAEIARLRNP